MSGNRRLARFRMAAVAVALAAVGISAARIVAKDGEKKAVYLAAETCVGCHEGYDKKFANTKHRVLFRDLKEKGPKSGCEGCHGAGDGHLDNPDAAVLHFSKATPEQASKACLKCHDNGDRKNWRRSAHSQEKLSCITCHKVHGKAEVKLDKSKNDTPSLLADSQPDLCISCHQDRAADINKSSKHPVKEGKVNCSDCHSPHDNSASAMAKAKTACVKCHAEKAGPFNFEHQPVSESCTNCHQPHGSPNKNLLIARKPGLCMQCHAPQLGVMASEHSGATSCTECHSYVHGSNSSGTFQSK